MGQQKRSLWVIEKLLCGNNDMEFFPSTERVFSSRDRDHAQSFVTSCRLHQLGSRRMRLYVPAETLHRVSPAAARLLLRVENELQEHRGDTSLSGHFDTGDGKLADQFSRCLRKMGINRPKKVQAKKVRIKKAKPRRPRPYKPVPWIIHTTDTEPTARKRRYS